MVAPATDRANNVGGPAEKNSSALISPTRMVKEGQDMPRFMNWSHVRIFIQDVQLKNTLRL